MRPTSTPPTAPARNPPPTAGGIVRIETADTPQSPQGQRRAHSPPVRAGGGKKLTTDRYIVSEATRTRTH